MKKFLVALTAVLTLNASFGQELPKDNLTIEKGTWYLGGNLSLGISDSKSKDFLSSEAESKNWNFNISPTIGYTFSPNWVSGLGLGYGYGYFNSSSQIDGGEVFESENLRHSLVLFPYIRRYMGVGEKLGLFLQGEIRYTGSWNDTEQTNSSDTSYNENNLFFGLRPGITYFISKKLALETSLGSFGYSRSKGKGDDKYENTSNSFGLSLNTSDLLFGLSYYF